MSTPLQEPDEFEFDRVPVSRQERLDAMRALIALDLKREAEGDTSPLTAKENGNGRVY